jgi:hypothetical protein
MSMHVMKADRCCLRWGAWMSAFVVLQMLTIVSCREEVTGPLAGQPATPVLRLTVGDSLLFDTWQLGVYGDKIPSSYAQILWCVTSVSDSFGGRTGVTTMIADTLGRPPTPAADTLRFQFSTNGDIFEFGYLTRIRQRHQWPAVPPTWDRIAALSLQVGDVWDVGTVDSLGEDLVEGFVDARGQYFVARVNGVATVFPGYVTTLAASNFSCGFSFADAPSALVVYQEDGTASTQGVLFLLASLKTRRLS